MHGALAPKPERQAVLVGYGVKLGATTRRARKAPADRPAAGAAAPAVAAPAVAAPAPAAPAGRPPAAMPADRLAAAVLAKPPVRKMARDLGVDLSGLAGTGPGGSITRDDVQAAAVGQTASPQPDAAPARTAASARPGAAAASLPREERIAIRGVRKHTAAAMAASAFTAPHVTEFLQIDITETMTATARLKALPEFADVRVSPLLLVARALIVAAARHPMINSSWDEAAQEIVIRHYVNLGIAAATDRGLVVPNVKDADALSLPDLARAIGDLAATARAGKTTPGDMRGGTITITNVGVFGVDTGTPILSPGEAGILAFGLVKDAPWVHEGQLAVRKVTTLALSFDHRVVDGDVGSAVLRDVGAMLEDPLRMLAWS
jgi:pyruvate dehydrogenase E2 component (dihydrolipoamide acetyltransferase)